MSLKGKTAIVTGSNSGIGLGVAIELARERLSRRHFVAATTLGRVYSPAEAAEVGFVDRVVAAERCVEEALATARKLAELPSGALAETKHLSRQSMVDFVLDTLDAGPRMRAPRRSRSAVRRRYPNRRFSTPTTPSGSVSAQRISTHN